MLQCLSTLICYRWNAIAAFMKRHTVGMALKSPLDTSTWKDKYGADKFLIQTFKTNLDSLSDAPVGSQEQLIAAIEEQCKRSQSHAKRSRTKDTLQRTFLNVRFERVESATESREAPPRRRPPPPSLSSPPPSASRANADPSSLSVETIYDDFMNIRAAYENSVAQSIESMAREERLYSKIEEMRNQIGKLKNMESNQNKKTDGTRASSASPPGFVSPVHLFILLFALFLAGRFSAGTSAYDVARWFFFVGVNDRADESTVAGAGE